VQMRRDDDGRGVGLELARRHGVLGLLGRRLLLGSRLVGVPLGHMRQLGWVGVHAGIVLLRVVVGGVGVVVDGRVRLRGDVVVVVRVLVLMLVREGMLVRQRVRVGVVGLAAGLMDGRHMGAGHGDLFIGGWARRARADVERGKPDTMSLYQHDMRAQPRLPGREGARGRGEREQEAGGEGEGAARTVLIQ
jgi:hypothetical protein